jgi:hypothetical protein
MPLTAEQIEAGDIAPVVELALSAVMSDTSVSQTATWHHLESIKMRIEEMQDSLDEADQNS